MTMERRVVFMDKGCVDLETFVPADPGPQEVTVRTEYSLVSAGTETRCLRGDFAAGTHWDQWVKYPFRPGYSAVGTIERTGREVTRFRPGDRVAVRRGHASAHVVSQEGCTPLPDGLSADVAVWFALAKIALIGVRAASVALGDSVAVIGAGPIGQMTTRWAAAAGVAFLAVIDPRTDRLPLAREGGADLTLACGADEAADEVAKVLGRLPETVIDTTGNPRVFGAALRLAAPRGRVVLLGDVGDPSEQHLTSDVIIKGLSVIGAHDCHAEAPWSPERMSQLFFHHVLNGRIDMSGMNTHRFRPEQAKEAYAATGSPDEAAMGILIAWE
jgi:2-desacetyl-2-hydroxyethyl bacteriochlorophyllide A dehydrogenase